VPLSVGAGPFASHGSSFVARHGTPDDVRMLAKNLALAAASVLLLLAGLEGVARLLGAPGFAMHPSPTNCLARSPRLGYELAPDCTGTLHGTPLHTNALGLRGEPLADDDAVRILALGDSSTFGWQVAEDETYPARLEAALSARYGPRGYHVLNAGVPGWTSHHGLVALEALAPAVRPKVVIIAFGFNDSVREMPVEQQIASTRAWLPLLQVDDFLLTHSVLWQRLRHGGGIDRSDAPPRVSPERYGENLRALVARVRALGAEPILLRFPADGRLFQDSENARWMGRYVDTFDAVAAEEHVPALTYRGPRLDDIHPDANGYQWLVADLIELMDERHLLPTAVAQ